MVYDIYFVFLIFIKTNDCAFLYTSFCTTLDMHADAQIYASATNLSQLVTKFNQDLENIENGFLKKGKSDVSRTPL